VYKINAKTGAIVLQRNLHIPFLTADLDGCVDINPLIGVTATGVIDPATDVWYLTAKTYMDQNPAGTKGKPNGRYYIHAIDTNTLAEKANFPVNIEGMVARNNPVRSFNGGIHHQRPALLQAGQFIYAGFASHCVQYNFTGWIVGWDKTSGTLVERFATQGGKISHSWQRTDWLIQSSWCRAHRTWCWCLDVRWRSSLRREGFDVLCDWQWFRFAAR